MNYLQPICCYKMELPNGLASGVLYRTAVLCNSERFSDVEFHVRDGPEHKVFYAHKLILSMAGEGFARWFYNGKSSVTKPVKISDFTPHIFEKMLQFVYCDVLNISSLEDAMELAKIAHLFGIHDLMVQCGTYLSRFPINIDTVFAKYETALSCLCMDTLLMCRKFVCDNTKDVFESPKFCNASITVVQDIVKLNDLSVSNEMEVIEAVIRWGKADCKRKNRPPDQSLCLREAIFPIFKNIRFLCLNVDEFLDFAKNYDILLNTECIQLTAKMLDPKDPSLTLPQEFSSICTPRSCLNIAPINGNSQPKSLAPVPSLETNPSFVGSSHSKPFDRSTPLSPNYHNNFRRDSTKVIPAPVQLHHQLHPLYSQRETPIPQPTSPKSQPLYQFMPTKKNAPVLKVIPQAIPKRDKFYEFPLREMQKEISSAFANDVKCNATITMLRGTILIRGIELRVKDVKTFTNELIEVHLCLSNKLTHNSNSHGVQLKNNTLLLSLNEPYKVSPGIPLDVEVTIEDLKLDRCSVCRFEENTIEINSGLENAAKISFKSNQLNGNDSFFFLVSKIIYSIDS